MAAAALVLIVSTLEVLMIECCRVLPAQTLVISGDGLLPGSCVHFKQDLFRSH